MYRTVPVNLWRDPWFEDLSAGAKHLFIYLLTCERTTPSGVASISVAGIAHDTKLQEDQVCRGLDALAKAGEVIWWLEHRLIFLRRFYRMQRTSTNPANFRIAAIRHLDGLPPEVLAAIGAEYPDLQAPGSVAMVPDKVGMDDEARGSMGMHGDGSPPVTESGTDPESEQDWITTAPAGAGPSHPPPSAGPPTPATRARRPPNGRARSRDPTPDWPDDGWIDAAFAESFWPLYPRKTHRAEAEKAWRALMRRQPTFEAALELAELILGVIDAQRRHWTEPAFTPHPATYLNERRWTDEQIIPTGAAAGRRR